MLIFDAEAMDKELQYLTTSDQTQFYSLVLELRDNTTQESIPLDVTKT
jgi:hypothetical protein